MTTAPVAVGGVVSWTYGGTSVLGTTNARLSFGPTLVDVTELGNTYMARFPTITDWTYTVDLVYDESDTGQGKIYTAAYALTSAAIVLTITGGTLTGTAYIESVDYTWDPKEVQRCTVTFKGTSALVFA
jgi:hypothetical protein